MIWRLRSSYPDPRSFGWIFLTVTRSAFHRSFRDGLLHLRETRNRDSLNYDAWAARAVVVVTSFFGGRPVRRIFRPAWFFDSRSLMKSLFPKSFAKNEKTNPNRRPTPENTQKRKNEPNFPQPPPNYKPLLHEQNPPTRSIQSRISKKLKPNIHSGLESPAPPPAPETSPTPSSMNTEAYKWPRDAKREHSARTQNTAPGTLPEPRLGEGPLQNGPSGVGAGPKRYNQKLWMSG